MAEKRMLIIDAQVAQKIAENCGDMSYSEFIDFLIGSQLKETGENQTHDYVEREEFLHFSDGMKSLLRNFLEFFLSYGLELGKLPQDEAFQEMNQKLQALGSTGDKGKRN
ncbi:hypothetical protein ACFLV3_05255 [Chloroflexota bacterium]